MASAIGKGDWVQCTDASSDFGRLFDGGFLIRGHVYCVEDVTVVRSDDGTLRDGVRLIGQPILHGMSGRRGAYGLWRFTPLGGNAKTLTAPPQRVTEDA